MAQDIYSAMQTSQPLARYKKVIVGKVHVIALDPFSDTPQGIILYGNPNTPDESAFIELWSEKAVAFFRRMNKKHIEAGRLIEMKGVPQEVISPNQITDEEIDEYLNSPFLKLKNRVATFTEPAPMLRMINRARELDKSEKLLKHLEGRMAEIELERI